MIRLAQPFSLNHPLVDGHGNYGNIDGDPAAHYRYCVTGDTLIKTNKGTLPIEELEQYSKGEILEGIEVVDFHGNFVPATRFFNSGEHEIFELILKNGQKLKGTGNHPVLTLDKKAFKPKWKKMEDLTGEEQVIVPYYNGYQETNTPKKTGSLEAKALGVMVSEGYITTQNRIGVNNTNKEMVSVVRDFFVSETGITANITEREGVFEFCFANKEYYNKFIDKYNYESQADKKYIPTVLWSSPVHDKAAFLSYLFEGDGSVIKSNNHICYSSYSERLVREIQIMLLQDFSIFSVVGKSSKEYRLIISGADVVSWNSKIGFVSERKQNASMMIEKNYKGLDKIAHNSYHSTKAVSDYFRTINNSYFMRKNSFSNIKNIDKAKDIIDKDEFNRVKKLMENFMFVDVKSIEKTNEKETVYSVRVDNLESDHSFMANGFINHNTEAKLSKVGEDMLKDIEKNTVNWKPNFSEDKLEPVVLPARLPQLLINGTTGI